MSEERAAHVSAQRAFYDGRSHEHLRPRADDPYAQKLAAEVARRIDVRPGHRVLEVGAGFGRFTFPLLDHCGSVTALDLSPRVLEDLARTRDERGIPAERCRTIHGDADEVDPRDLGGPVDRIVGFFILHHLPDMGTTLRRLAALLQPGGRMAFLEPNRLNPLFALQVLVCPDMTWREERGMFRLSAGSVAAAFHHAGLEAEPVHRFGFFPPQVFNRLRLARRLEARLEDVGALHAVLPFLVLGARKPEAGSADR